MRLVDTGRIFALFMAAFVPLALAGCGGSSADTHASEHGASQDHGDHGHDNGDRGHAEHGDHGDHGHAHDATTSKTEGARSGVDPVGAVKAFEQPPQAGTKALCPVCGEAFVVAEDTPRSEHAGKHYAHCGASCKTKFDAGPAEFVAPPAGG